MIRLEACGVQLGALSIRADLKVARGQICALIGPSGAGKSSILNILAGFLAHGEDQVFLDDQDMAACGPAQRPVSMIFQEHNLFPHLSVQENVGLGLSPELRLGVRERARIDEALQAVGLEGHAAKKPRALSGGERQRAALARALLREKPVLLLDEPFAALGPALRKDMLALIAQLARDKALTVLMVTHHPEDAKAVSDVTAFMDQGVLQGARATDALFATPDAGLKAYLGMG